MPVEFTRNDARIDIHEQIVCGSMKLVMAYDGSGRSISKTRMKKTAFDGPWYASLVTHYTGIGSEIREEYHNGELQSTKVVVNMPVFFRVTLTRLKPRSYIEKDILRLSNGGAILPKQSFGASRQGLGRYGIENADGMAKGDEFYLKNHLGSTMMVAQVSSTNASEPAKVAAAYDYRAFGEQVTLKKSADKVTENFTGKERDDETLLSYHGARYLDPMLGVWISVDPKRFFSSPYLYMGNGYNPILFFDLNGMKPGDPFGSPQEAAIDFAKLYNGVSIATSTEYGTIIYRKGNSFSYVTPSLGTSRTVDLDECVLDVAENAELQLITSAHTHGSYSGFRSLEPSSLDFSSEFIPTDINLYPYYKENMNEPAYVAVPNGTLIEYRSDGSQRVVPAGGLAADPQSRWGDVDKQYHADLGLLE